MDVLCHLVSMGWINYAMCYLLIDSAILELPREAFLKKLPRFAAMLECYFCTGFWSALFIITIYLESLGVLPQTIMDCRVAWVPMYFLTALALAAASQVGDLLIFKLSHNPQGSDEG